jgi:hypothetical protein
LTLKYRIANPALMKAKRLFLLLVAASLTFPSLETLADSPVTFEVVLTFDYPRVDFTNPNGINDHGDVAGYFVNPARFGGFVRLSDGQFIGPIMDPNNTQDYTEVTGINNLDVVCGNYLVGSNYRSFLLSRSTFTEIDIGASDTLVQQVNDAGNFCGFTTVPPEGFVSIGGTVSSIAIPGADYTYMGGINNLNQCVGSYQIGNDEFGFRRDADGTLAYPIQVPGAQFTVPEGINDNGLMVGFVFADGTYHAVFFNSSHKHAIYDYPGASYTVFKGINNRGLICGTYYDGSATRGLIVRARLAAGK